MNIKLITATIRNIKTICLNKSFINQEWINEA